MRTARFGLVVALAALVGIVGAWALAGIPANAQALRERVLMDVTLRVAAGATEGHCLLLDAGTLEASVQAVNSPPDDRVGAPLFMLGPYRTTPAQAGSPPEIEGIRVSAARTTATLPVEGGLHCYSFSAGSTPEIDALPSREQAAHFRFVALRMTLAPRG